MVTILYRVVKKGLVEDFAHRHDHLFFYISHPELNVTFLWIDSFNKIYLFTFNRHHRDHAIIVTEFQVCDGFEHLSQMGTHTAHFFRLR